jgi:hypothetical protein
MFDHLISKTLPEQSAIECHSWPFHSFAGELKHLALGIQYGFTIKYQKYGGAKHQTMRLT